LTQHRDNSSALSRDAKFLSFREALRCPCKDYTPHLFGNYDAKFLSFREAIRCPRKLYPPLWDTDA